MSEVIHYMGYMAVKTLKENEIIWEIYKDDNLIITSPYSNYRIDNLNKINEIINNLNRL
jgi:hypothetical protein